MKLIVNADDFGYCNGVNKGIVQSFEQGILTSTTLMVNQKGTKEAVSLIKDGLTLSVGLHFNMTLGKPLSNCKSMLKSNGEFFKPVENPNFEGFDEKDIYGELKAQFDSFCQQTGREPTHIDSHLYAHQIYPSVNKIVVQFGIENNIPIRNEKINDFEKARFLSFFKVKGKTKEILIEEIIQDKYKIILESKCELMCHPAVLDKYLMENSSYNIDREKELKILLSREIINFVKNNNIKLIDFRGKVKE